MTTHWFISALTGILFHMSIGVAVVYSCTLLTARAILAGWCWRFPTPDARRTLLARRADWRESATHLGERWPSPLPAILTSYEVGRWVRGLWGWQDPHPPFEFIQWYLLCALALALMFGGLQGTNWFRQQCLRESAASPEAPMPDLAG